jgi:hypothetical protein
VAPQEVECLPSKCEALSSNPSTAKKKKKKKKNPKKKVIRIMTRLDVEARRDYAMQHVSVQKRTRCIQEKLWMERSCPA